MISFLLLTKKTSRHILRIVFILMSNRIELYEDVIDEFVIACRHDQQ